MTEWMERLRRIGRVLRPPPNDPFAIVQGVFDALEGQARERGDTRAIGQLRDARATVVREAIRNLKS